MNFKLETTKEIGEHKVDEYCLRNMSTGKSYHGKGDVDWSKIPTKLLNYNAGYGLQEWAGWITFVGTGDWIERFEYDGSEWWQWCERPTLQKLVYGE